MILIAKDMSSVERRVRQISHNLTFEQAGSSCLIGVEA